MKATLEFSLPEEAEEHRMAVAGADAHYLINELDQDMRGALKYGYENKFKTVGEALEYYRNLIRELAFSGHVKLD